MDGDGDAHATRGRLRVPLHVAPDDRLPPRPTPGPRRSHRQMGETEKAPLDRPGDLRRAARVPGGPRMPGPGGTAGLPCDDARRRHDVAGRVRVYPRRSAAALSRAVERRTPPE